MQDIKVDNFQRYAHKIDIDGADFYSKLEVEQEYPDTHLTKDHNLSDDTHPIKNYQIL